MLLLGLITEKVFANIREHLDRTVVNDDWRVLFPRGNIVYLTRASLDHSPLLLDTVGKAASFNKSLKFEKF